MKRQNKATFEIFDNVDGSLISGPFYFESTATQLASELNEHYGEPDRFSVVKREPMPFIARNVIIDNDNGIAFAYSVSRLS